MDQTVSLEVCLFVDSEELSVEDMNRMIGVKCNKSWRKGDPRHLINKVYATSSWQLHIETDVPTTVEDIENQMNSSIADILHRMQGHEQAFRKAASETSSGLVIAMSSPFVPPIIVTADVLEGICRLGVDLEFDITLSGDLEAP